MPFFKNAETSFISSLVACLTPLQAAPGDFVIIAGELGLEMFFIDFGEVEIWSADMSARYRKAASGEFFGEVALLTRERRTANCKAVSYVELWSLSRDDLERLCGDSPEMEEKMQKCAQQRLAAQLHYELQHDEAKATARGEDDGSTTASEDSTIALPPGMMRGGDGVVGGARRVGGDDEARARGQGAQQHAVAAEAGAEQPARGGGRGEAEGAARRARYSQASRYTEAGGGGGDEETPEETEAGGGDGEEEVVAPLTSGGEILAGGGVGARGVEGERGERPRGAVAQGRRGTAARQAPVASAGAHR